MNTEKIHYITPKFLCFFNIFLVKTLWSPLILKFKAFFSSETLPLFLWSLLHLRVLCSQNHLTQRFEIFMCFKCSLIIFTLNIFFPNSEIFLTLTWYSAWSILLVSLQFFLTIMLSLRALSCSWFIFTTCSFWESEFQFSLFLILFHVL